LSQRGWTKLWKRKRQKRSSGQAEGAEASGRQGFRSYKGRFELKKGTHKRATGTGQLEKKRRERIKLMQNENP